MLFSKFTMAALLALADIVASQVIVTVTSTITVVTVTVTPLSTSTKTTYVTVSASPTKSTITIGPGPTVTSTTVVVITVAPPSSTAITTCPIPLYYQCGGRSWSGCTHCTAGASCVSANEWYYQCQATTGPQVVTITSTIWGIH